MSISKTEKNGIFFIRQESLDFQQFSRNEISKQVHVVAKNIPFILEIGSNSINFKGKSKIAVKLYYDSATDTDFKQVDYLKQEPMSYKVFPNDVGDKATIEIRLLVLTSQHEDSLFRVKITASENNTTTSYDAFSEPLRVVSKASQIQREKERASDKIKTEGCIPLLPMPGTKRGASESILLDTLQRVETEQREQRKLIQQLVIKKEPGTEFEHSFSKLLEIYNQLPTEERSNKIRKVLTQPGSYTFALNDFLIDCATSINTAIAIPTEKPLSLSQILEEGT